MKTCIRARWMAGCVIVALAGCFKPGQAPEPKSLTKTDPRRGPVKVKTDGACLQLGELQQSTVIAATLVSKVGEHLAAGRHETARRYVLRFPEAAEEAILGCEQAHTGAPAVRFIAAVCDAETNNAGWQAWLDQRNGPSKGYAATRAEMTQFLREGQAGKAVGVDLPGRAPAGPAAVEAHCLHGQALLLADKSKEAATAFEAGAKAAKTDPARAAACLLLCGEAQRRAGDASAAKATWARAVHLAAGTIRPQSVAFDPVFWERAAYLKPSDATWPEPVILATGEFAENHVALPTSSSTSVPEMWVWAAIGRARLERAECHAALTAFKRAETMTTDPSARDGFAVAQARTLLLLGQTQAASGMLVSVGSNTKSRYAPAATALLGAMKLAEGAPEPAVKLLTQALTAPGEWPGRAEAEADLGLAYLSRGDESNGLRWLAAGRAKFQATGEIELLSQSWQNEARYWDSLSRATDAATAREAARALEANRITQVTGTQPPEPRRK